MTTLTFYIYKGDKHKKIAIHTLRKRPADWATFKDELQVCALKLWHEHQFTSKVPITLELHLGGKYVQKTRKGGFRPISVHWKRSIEWQGILSFNIKTQELTVERCVFGPNLTALATDYYAERGIKYRTPSVIPRMHQTLDDAKSLLMDPSPARYADYSRRQHTPYTYREGETKKEKTVYGSACAERNYLPASLNVE